MSYHPTTVGLAAPHTGPNAFLRLQGSSLEFRDEQIYLKSIAPYVHLSRRKGKEREHDDLPGDSYSDEVITIEWRKVLWITARDQLFMPLFRGLVWGIAGQYVSRVGSLFVGRGGNSRASGPHKEGQGVGWLRQWISHLTSGTRASTPSIPPRGL